MGELATDLKSGQYYAALGCLRDRLGLPANTKHTEIEALLIFITKDVYGETSEADITLMALGLLQKCNNRTKRAESDKNRWFYAERRDRFLRETNYISIRTEEKCKTYQDAKNLIREVKDDGKVKTELDTICGSLDTAATRYIQKILSTLDEKKQSIEDYLKAAKASVEKEGCQQGIKTFSWRNGEYIPSQLLPTLKYYKWIPEELAPPTTIIEGSLNGENALLDQSPENGEKSVATPPTHEDGEPPSPTSYDGPESLPTNTHMKVLWERIARGFQKGLNSIENHTKSLSVILSFVIAISVIKMAFFFDYKETGYQNGVERIDAYAPQDSLPFVDGLKCTVPKVTIYPGRRTPLPIEVNPPEAQGSFLYCNSSDSSILCGISGPEVYVYAFDDIDIDVTPVTVIVTVTPKNRASSDVAIEIPVEIDYGATMPESVIPEEAVTWAKK